MGMNTTLPQLETATFANGCFWCTEAIFQRTKGVISVKPGFTGGFLPNPTYEQVCSGRTGHAEAIQINFDPTQISYEKLLEVFFKTHDPTTRNRQGNDVGTQYRSAIFYHSEAQKNAALTLKQKLVDAEVYAQPIVTEIAPFSHFYPAEEYHQNYYNKNQDYPYCQAIINPKLTKFFAEFKDYLK